VADRPPAAAFPFSDHRTAGEAQVAAGPGIAGAAAVVSHFAFLQNPQQFNSAIQHFLGDN
jgi:hypothetical protein